MESPAVGSAAVGRMHRRMGAPAIGAAGDGSAGDGSAGDGSAGDGNAGRLDAADAAQATAEGALLGLYRFAGWKHRERPEAELDEVLLVVPDEAAAAAAEAGLAAARAVAAGVFLARDLVNLPPNLAHPEHLAATARRLARQHGLEAFVGDRAWAAEQRMGAFLAVAQGSAREPAFVVLEHRPAADAPTVVLVGKGVTFDSGGLSLKTREGMVPMKSDMGGAAAVLGAMRAVAELDLPLHVVGVCPCVENMPDGAAYRPSDVILAADGTSIEILSTDAEGRLALADALLYAKRHEPSAVIDLATLTGSCVVALGKGVAAGLFGNDDALRSRLERASAATFERAWPLPLYDDYRRSIDSGIADLRNSGGRDGGIGTSAAFLHAFTSYPWAHLDIAGMALSSAPRHYTPEGGTGFGVRLLVQTLRDWS